MNKTINMKGEGGVGYNEVMYKFFVETTLSGMDNAERKMDFGMFESFHNVARGLYSHKDTLKRYNEAAKLFKKRYGLTLRKMYTLARVAWHDGSEMVVRMKYCTIKNKNPFIGPKWEIKLIPLMPWQPSFANIRGLALIES